MSAPFPPGSIVAAYLRDSGGESQELSVPQQLAAFHAFCVTNGLVPGAIFQDIARPGSSTIGRDGFHAMMDHFRHAAPEAGLVIWSYSRFARDFDSASFYRADLRRRGYILHSLTDNVPDGHLGRLFESIIDWKNEQFLEDLSRDVKRGLANLVAVYGAVPGTPPVGFTRQPVEIGRRRDGSPHIVHRWQPDPALAPTIRQAFEMRASAVPLQDIHRQTRLYKTINSYPTFFANPIYKGVLVYSGVVYPDYCPPIVEPAIWQAAQRKQRQYHPRRQNSAYLLSGLLHCARCGAPLAGLTRRNHQSYACTNQRPHRLCDLQPIPAHVLDDAVIAAVVDYALSPPNLQAQLDAYQSAHAERQADLDQRRKRLRANQTDLTRQIDHVTDAIAQHSASVALLDKLRCLELDLAGLQAESYALERQAQPEPPSQPDMEQQAAQLRQALASDHETAQRTLRGLVARIVVDRHAREVTGLVTCFFTPT